MTRSIRHAAALAFMVSAATATAETAPTRGPETNLPLPRYVSMRADEGNVRRGPSLSHRIDWVFQRRNLPLKVTAEFGHWRKVEDSDGQGGWMHYALLSGSRTALVTEDITLQSRPDGTGQPVALFEAGVVAWLTECQPDWCRISAKRQKGWAPKAVLWGVDSAEVFE